ncbi:MAG: 3-phosphoserine/phosphohydroxythreonine transaminase [Planctomycetota bacterium]|nr:3-phosphoserine/phosphohydroxythreonine transaminase [Planctomycetota bacterium]
MKRRKHNFGAGPGALPLEVLEKARDEIPLFGETGMSVMELSHRGGDYAAIHEKTTALLVELLGIPSSHKVIYLQGGASLQFAMVPMNFRKEGESADYVVTGTWSKKAVKEGQVAGKVHVAASSEGEKFTRIPEESTWDKDPNAAYLHITSNNTITGTQFSSFPETGNVPLVADMSSDILSKRIDVSKFGLIYAGAQKNLGPAGVTVVIVREDLLERAGPEVPIILSYKTHAKNDSLYNTPPTFTIHMVGLVLDWVKGLGGLEGMEKRNQEKADLLYGAIDKNPDFFRSTVGGSSRSRMNITYRLPSEDLEKRFIEEGSKVGFVGLKGHRFVGGIRISAYNATGPDSIRAFVRFMEEFASKNE